MSFPRIPQAVVFDMDGVLFDTEAIARDAMIATARRLGFQMPEQLFLSLVGLPADTCRQRLLDHYGAGFDVDGYWTQVDDDFLKLLTGRQFVKAGVVELLGLLDRIGMKRAIATSSHRSHVERNLAAHDLQGRFHVVVAHGDYARGKPNPDPFLKAAEGLGVAPEYCLALEDSHNGIRAAAAAGMMTVMVPDLIEPTDEIRKLCLSVARDLHEVCELLHATNQRVES
jgi:HAD superfamily hydrolase (TIGR01509 family)